MSVENGADDGLADLRLQRLPAIDGYPEKPDHNVLSERPLKTSTLQPEATLGHTFTTNKARQVCARISGP
jgi:hypothetical protein